MACAGIVGFSSYSEALLTCKISEQRLLIFMRPAIGLARFTVSSYMM